MSETGVLKEEPKNDDEPDAETKVAIIDLFEALKEALDSYKQPAKEDDHGTR